jgi:hypothetical protein
MGMVRPRGFDVVGMVLEVYLVAECAQVVGIYCRFIAMKYGIFDIFRCPRLGYFCMYT